MNLPIYLDYASTTPVDPRVVEKMQDCLSMEGNFGNPASRSHAFGCQAEEATEQARQDVADLVNCDTPRAIRMGLKFMLRWVSPPVIAFGLIVSIFDLFQAILQ